jgi:hypothetical protein
MTIMTTKNMTTMMNEYDSDYDYDYDTDYNSEDDRPRISLFRKQPRAPAPVNLPSMKKEKENKEKLRKEKETEETHKKNVETFRSTAHTGIWGLPGWMVADQEVEHVMEAKEKLQSDLASGEVVLVSKEPETETPKIEKKENLRDVAFEVLADKEKMKTAFEKTELCRSITQGGVCPHGEHCRFLHDVALWKPRKCRFEDTCKCVKFISKPNGTFYIVNNRTGEGSKVCKFIHGGESRDNFHARTKIPKPQFAAPVTTAVPVKKTFSRTSVDDGKETLKGKLNWLAPTPTVVTAHVPVVAPFNWAQVQQQLKADGISLVAPVKVAMAEPAQDEWITPKTKSQKRVEKAAPVPVRAPVTRAGYMHQHTSLCRSVIQGVQCTHAVCRYAHDVEKIMLRNCGFEGCRNVTCVGDGVYRNTGRNVCNYLHQGETRDSYYKRLDIYKYKK